MSRIASTKYCPDCEQIKSADDFTRNAARPDGLCHYCKICYRARCKASYERRRLAMGKKLRVRPEVPTGHKYCPDCEQVKPLGEWHKNSTSSDGFASYCKACRAIRGRQNHLKSNYGLTIDEYRRMFDAQGGLCAICRERPAEHIDHHHGSGRVRGLTCFPCNGGIGQFKENVNWLESAIEYLREFDPERDNLRVEVAARLERLNLPAAMAAQRAAMQRIQDGIGPAS